MIQFILVGVISSILFLVMMKYLTKNQHDIKNKYIVITGGSSGIGKSLAVLCARRGAHVTIVARNQQRLDQALNEVKENCVSETQVIQAVSLDISHDYELIQSTLSFAESQVGSPTFMLVNCAGSAICGKLDQLTESQIKSQFELNTVGSILPTKAVLPGMKERSQGHIVFVASQAAYCGIYGLTAYSASKFALRGFAEALNMEVQPFNIKVTVSYPPDTDTPGYHEEEKAKPRETSLISETSGLYKPDQVAATILDHALEGQFSSNIGLDGFILEHLCCGMSPYQSLLNLLIQISTMGLLRLVAVLYNIYFGLIIKKCHSENIKSVLENKEKEKQDDTSTETSLQRSSHNDL